MLNPQVIIPSNVLSAAAMTPWVDCLQRLLTYLFGSLDAVCSLLSPAFSLLHFTSVTKVQILIAIVASFSSLLAQLCSVFPNTHLKPSRSHLRLQPFEQPAIAARLEAVLDLYFALLRKDPFPEK